ncbi:hypothetical protein UT300012_32820 [Paraclostridium bifermentans]
MKVEETRYNEILPVYHKIANAADVLTKGVMELSKLNIVDEDIERINKLDLEASEELFLLAGEIDLFKENAEKILDGII